MAQRFVVSVRTVERLWQRQREQGHCRAGKHGGHLRSRLEGHEDTVRQWISQKNDLTLEELCRRLDEHLGIKLGVSALWYRLEAMGLSYKKKRCAPPSKNAPM